MLLDLGRNDVGRVAKIGTVTRHRAASSSSAIPMSCTSSPTSRASCSRTTRALSTCCKATFPAGTVSGAPKVRAMEIIDELEPVKRGIYAGAVGYLGFNGDMDLAIAIRTAVIKDGKLYVQAGAGIVADSDPDCEWQETQNKARALLARRRNGRGRPRHAYRLRRIAMLLMIDNYDSFTYNLVQYFGELGEEVRVFRNDAITVDGDRGA